MVLPASLILRSAGGTGFKGFGAAPSGEAITPGAGKDAVRGKTLALYLPTGCVQTRWDFVCVCVFFPFFDIV